MAKKLPDRRMKTLTKKQQIFVNEYVLTGNATQSALKAGYSKKTAVNIASENLTKLNIKEAIAKLRQPAGKDYEWSREKLVKLTQTIIAKSIAPSASNKGQMNDGKLAMQAITQLCKMQGYDDPSKHTIDIKNMTTDELKSAIRTITTGA